MQALCPYCSVDPSLVPGASGQRMLAKTGKFYRKSDSRWIQRYLCLRCKRSSSKATFDPCYRQNKRSLNPRVFKLLCSALTQRRFALLFGINRKTVARKLVFLGRQAEIYLRDERLKREPIAELEFDEIITLEHTKCKPVSILMAVEAHTRRIASLDVASMPANGKLAAISRKKYGKRKDERKKVRREFFQTLQTSVAPNAIIRSDENPHYPKDVKHYFPKCKHQQVKGRRGCVTGQGELKKIGHDPIFSFNHTAAMMRANISTLFRRTWNTAKKISSIRDRVLIYAQFHNQFLLLNPTMSRNGR